MWCCAWVASWSWAGLLEVDRCCCKGHGQGRKVGLAGLVGLTKIAPWINEQVGLAGLTELAGLATWSRKQEVLVGLLTQKAGLWRIRLT
jgi:hypothetical protein